VARFIATQRVRHGIPHASACRALGVSQAWFYKWWHGDVSLRRARKRALVGLVAALFARHHGTYGSPRITADLRDLGWRVSENTVAGLMREHGVAAKTKRKFRCTTDSNHDRPVAENVLDR